MTTVWIGTSGWHYSHWKGRFYPDKLAPSGWLSFYAQRFSTVEVNASFYRQPRAGTWDAWRDTVPPGFLFAVKASRYITHIRRLADAGEPLQRILDGARRLGDRLGPLLYQMPPSFHRTGENVARLEAFLSLLPRDVRHAFEFRHKSWFGEDTVDQLRRHGVAYCCYHRGQTESPLVVTAPHAYMRFHGAGGILGGDYPDDMLEVWSRRLRGLSGEADHLFVYFNNDAFGYAVANAARLASLMGAPLGLEARPAASSA